MKIAVVMMCLLFASISFAAREKSVIIGCGTIQISTGSASGTGKIGSAVMETYFISDQYKFLLIDDGHLKSGVIGSLKDGQVVTISGSAQENGYGELELTPFGIYNGCH